MEAKDTVMRKNMVQQQVELLIGQIADGTFFGVEKGTTIEKPVAEFLDDWVGQQTRNLEAQAEISFKAGYDQGKSETTIEYRDFHYEDGKAAGIKEVVDWIEENKRCPEGTTLNPDYHLYLGYGYRAQLKEWGIRED